MTLLLLEGFDDGLRDVRWNTISLPAVQTSSYNRLGKVQRISARTDTIRFVIAAADQHATLTVGMWARAFATFGADVPAADSLFQFRSDVSSTLHVAISLTVLLELKVLRGDGTLLGITDVVWESATSPHYIEIQVVLHDTTGSVQIWKDGNSILNLTNIDTKNGGTAAVFSQFLMYGGASNNDRQLLEFDDMYVTNGAGAAPYNGNLGDIVVNTLFPNGNGNYSAFVGSDGNSVDNYLLVDENPHDSDTTYVESGVDTDRDSYVFDDLVSASGVIRGVIATAIVRNSGAADNLQVSTRISSTDYDGATQAAPAGFGSFEKVWQVSPATLNDWTISEVNAAEFGIENVT